MENGVNVEWATDEIALVNLEAGRFPLSNSFLVVGDKIALIDTGCSIQALEHVKESFEPDLIINSHTHPDHIAGNWVFEGYEIWSPIQSRESAGRSDELAKRFAEEGKEELWKSFIAGAMSFRDCPPTEFFGDGYIFDLGGISLKAIHAPGHINDHYCFFIEDEKALFSGDIDLSRFGPWYGHRESDIGQFKRSIKLVKNLKPEVVLPSHREIIRGRGNIENELDRYLRVFDEREKKILDFLEEERTLDDFVEKSLIYGGYPYGKEVLGYWERQMVLKHLKMLMVEGRVESDGILFRSAKR
jgi:glyoxylase-like metal-dependent hydrolase (beta-lactamase superfamily II)